MARIKLMLPVILATALLFSLVFVNGSIAQPLGEGLLQRFGVSSNGTNGGTDAALPFFGVPVTVVNPDTKPVPVSVQGSSSQPLTATIDGTVDTHEADPAGAQPYQIDLPLDASEQLDSVTGSTPPIPAGKRLILRYVSGSVGLSAGEFVEEISVTTSVGGTDVRHVVPCTFVGQLITGSEHYVLSTETWIEADAGTQVQVSVGRDEGLDSWGADIVLSGYLIDAPAPTP